MGKKLSELTALELGESKLTVEKLFIQLGSSINGISNQEATRRQKQYGFNQLVTKKELPLLVQLAKKFINPLTITLLLVALLSSVLGQQIEAIIVALMAVLSTVLAFIQEHFASNSAKKLQAMIDIKATVVRDGHKTLLPIKELVPGDVIELSAGKMVPADVRIIDSNHFSVNQSVLTGESFPVDKSEKLGHKHSGSIFDTPNLCFMGSSVSGGVATAIVISTGKNTEFGKLSLSLLSAKRIDTPFDKGIRSFTLLMIRLIALLVLVIFTANVALKGDSLEAILFALAVAVGLTPEMLPMIVTINLSKGAIDMAKKKVIIKEIESIQNFVAIYVLLTNKKNSYIHINALIFIHHLN